MATNKTETINNPLKYRFIIVDKLNADQNSAVTKLKNIAFTNVSKKEIKLDFYHPEIAHVLAYIGGKLIGWAGIYESEQMFDGRNIKIGGYGICTHPNYRKIGIASSVSIKAMELLKEGRYDIAFLSVEPENLVAVKLHEKNGYVLLNKDFSWTNSKGDINKDSGGMIAPLGSPALFQSILDSNETLYVGNGYW